jgi:hypothetical protein
MIEPDGLARVCGKPCFAGGVETIGRPEESDRSLLERVEQIQSLVLEPLRHPGNETEVVLEESLPRLLDGRDVALDGGPETGFAAVDPLPFSSRARASFSVASRRLRNPAESGAVCGFMRGEAARVRPSASSTIATGSLRRLSHKRSASSRSSPGASKRVPASEKMYCRPATGFVRAMAGTSLFAMFCLQCKQISVRTIRWSGTTGGV